jgi:hypothetical protein
MNVLHAIFQLYFILKETSQTLKSITKTYKGCSETCSEMITQNFNVSCYHSAEGRAFCAGVCTSASQPLLVNLNKFLTLLSFSVGVGFYLIKMN